MSWSEQHEPRFRAICDLVEEAGDELHVLDVGAAPFGLTDRILGLDSVGRVTALTLERDGQRSHERLSNGKVPVVTCNIEREQWPCTSDYDVIVMGAILEHLFEPAFALHQARMNVATAGRLVLSTPNGVSLKTRFETLLGQTPHDGFDPEQTRYDRHQHEYSREELVSVLESVGWNVTSGIRTVNLNRNGTLGSVYQRLARGSLADQLVVSAHAGRIRAGRPSVYRDSLVTRE
jgi:2-polyprenyl-3-methyl-5-hydroxy-6-metoxy-1,4-benzoquinol methylase